MTVGKLSHLIDVRPAGGNAFFIDGVSGAAANNGRDPDSPLLTLKSALALCRNNNRDIIYVLDYPWDGGVTGEAQPIVVDKSTVTIVGVGRGTYNIPVIGTSIDSAAITISASAVRFVNLEFAAASAAHALVEIIATCFRLRFEECLFDVSIRGPATGAYDGLRVNQTFDAPDLVVAGCHFGRGLRRDGVRVITNSTRGKIGLPGNGNFFDKCPGIAINLGTLAGVASMGVFDNRISVYDDTAGKAITITLGSDCFIDGNHANYGTGAMTANPYRDLGSNHWGLNYKAGVSTMPVTE